MRHEPPNARGDLGIAFSWGTAAMHISTAYLVDDDFNDFLGAGPFTFSLLRIGTGGPSPAACGGGNIGCWGDYIRTRPHKPSGYMWISSGHTVQGAGIEPGYYVVGRERDQLSFWKYFWTSFCGPGGC